MHTVSQRVNHVSLVLAVFYGHQSGDCRATQGVGIIADLLHLCDCTGYDFDEMLRQARMYHFDELEEEIAAAGGRN